MGGLVWVVRAACMAEGTRAGSLGVSLKLGTTEEFEVTDDLAHRDAQP